MDDVFKIVTFIEENVDLDCDASCTTISINDISILLNYDIDDIINLNNDIIEVLKENNPSYDIYYDSDSEEYYFLMK